MRIRLAFASFLLLACGGCAPGAGVWPLTCRRQDRDAARLLVPAGPWGRRSRGKGLGGPRHSRGTQKHRAARAFARAHGRRMRAGR